MIAETRELSPVRLKDAQQGTFLAVRGVTAKVSIDGPLSRTALTITFHNDLDRTLEGDLVFPLPPSAALRELTVEVGKRTLQGKIRPRQRAQAEYTRAVQAGQTAALGETEGEDLARLRVAPIEKGEDVAITIVLVHVLLPIDSGHRLLLPLTYMPRFVEDGGALKDVERAAVDRPRPLTLAARAGVEIRIRNVDGQAPAFRCTSHTTHAETAPGETVVTVASAPLDRDLHLEIQDRPKGGEPAVWIRHDAGDGPDALGPTTAVAIVPPAFADEGPAVPRTVTFLVDRSGSMDGGPMQSAIRAVRGSLRALGPDDRFNVVAFDDQLEVLAPRPVAFVEKTLQAADAFIAGIAARGGTNASMAIMAALQDAQTNAQVVALQEAPPLDAGHRLRIVVFMTDGDVAGAEQVLKSAREKLVDTRIHVIGIGHSVNHAMLAAIASAGGGTYLPVATDEDLEQALARLKNAINAPLWTGIKVSIDQEGERRSPKQIEPSGPLDLFAGQPLLLAFRGKLEPGDRLVLEGQRPGGDDRRVIVKLDAKEGDAEAKAAAPVVWALLRNRRLTYRFDAADDATLEGLGTTFGLTNRMVALVGVHADQRGVTVEGSLPVALPMPGNVADASASLTRAGGGGPARYALLGGPPPAPPPAAYGAPAGGYGPPPPPPPGYAAPMGSFPQAPGGFSPSMPFSDASGGFPPPPPAYTPPPPPGFGPPSPPGFGPPPPMASAPSAAARPAPASPSMLSRAKMALGFGGAPSAQPPSPPEAKPASPALTDNEAGLRALMLSQGADGLFAGDPGATLAAVAALVTRGHTHREGLFRAELRRTVGALRSRLAAGGDARVFAALALALLTVPAGDAPPAELPAPLSAAIAGLSTADLPAARNAVRAALAAAPASWRAHALAADVARVFRLLG